MRILAMTLALAALGAGAATYDATTGYVTQNVYGTAANDSPFNPGTANDSKAGAFWSDGLALHAGTNYYCSKGGRLPYPNAVKDANGQVVNDIVLPANRIVLPKVTLALKTYLPASITFANEGLFCLGGSVFQVNDANTLPFPIGGLVTLQGTTSSNPFKVYPCNVDFTDQTVRFTAKIRTTATSDQLFVPRSDRRYGTVQLLGDMTEFDGWVNVSSNRVTLGNTGLDAANAVLSLNNGAELTTLATNGATVAVRRIDQHTSSRIVVAATNVLHARSLRILDAGTALTFGVSDTTNGCLVADALELPASGTIPVALTCAAGMTAFTNTPRTLTVLRAPAGTLQAGRFVAKRGGLIGAAPLPCVTLGLRSDGTYDYLTASWEPIVTQVRTIASAAYAAYYNEAATWSNGKTLSEGGGCDFFSSGSLSLYTVASSSKPEVFPGRSFTKDGGMITFQCHYEYTFTNLYIKTGTLIRCWPCGTTTIAAPTEFYGSANTVTKCVIGNRTHFHWRGDWTGAAPMWVALRQFGSDINDTEPCSFHLSGTNTAFTGTWLVQPESYELGTRASAAFPGFENYYLGFGIREQANLGGPLAQFTYDALTLWDWQALVADADAVTLDDTTRGVNAVGTVQFLVASGRTLSVKVPLTLAGTIKKKGAGTLALGGASAPRFCQANRYTAAEVAARGLAGTNILWVAEGAVKPLSKEATDGLAIWMGPSAALQLDLEPTGDAATYGLYNVAWGTPIAAVDASGAAAADGTIAVSFGLPPSGIEEKAYVVPVCTVASSAAAALRGKFVGRAPAKNFAVRFLETEDAAAGTVTFSARIAPAGFIVIVR